MIPQNQGSIQGDVPVEDILESYTWLADGKCIVLLCNIHLHCFWHPNCNEEIGHEILLEAYGPAFE